MKNRFGKKIKKNPMGELHKDVVKLLSCFTFLCIYVVVQFYPWFNFYFPLFFFM